jgi:hypothetical protein
MVFNTQNHWIYGLRPSSGILNTRNATYRKLELFPFSCKGRETHTLLRPLDNDPVIEVSSF